MASNGNQIRLPPKWIELNLTKRECSEFISSTDEESLCQCGRRKADHCSEAMKPFHNTETWIPSIHTSHSPTDAYGTLIFEGEQHPNKAHFVRLSYDTNPELVIQLMTLVWGQHMPKLLITIHGGSSNFELSPRLGKVLQTGLIKAAKSCDAWIFTGGLNDGVTKHVGVALTRERSMGTRHGGRIATVGIAPWGVVEHREDLLVKNKDKTYSSLEHAQSKFRLLNPRHSNFLLVDNGSVGKMGGETYFRRRLEKCIARSPTGQSINRGCDIPVVCLIIEGGFHTLRTIGDYLHDEPPTPVVIFGGSGRTADLISWIFKRLQQLPEVDNLALLREDVYSMMMKIYQVNVLQCVVLFAEIKRILTKRNLVTIYGLHGTDEDLDATILSSLFRSQHWSPLQQLSLTLVWDRVDIAISEVFVYGREWATEHLEQAMMEALETNRIEFVSLLLEHGLNMESFLTVTRLEILYNAEHSRLLKKFVSDLAKLRSVKGPGREKGPPRKLTMHDIGIAISHMMGHLYKSSYIQINTRNGKAQPIHPQHHSERYLEENLDPDEITFKYPFDDLFVWAVLTKRHHMALLFWRHGAGGLAKALVGVKLNKFIFEQLEETERTEKTAALEFQAYANEWEAFAFKLVDNCFKQDQKFCRQLLTMELDCWSKTTGLTLAVMANHRMLLGHPCCQMLLADLWMGALNIRTHSTIKILMGILCPPFIFVLDFKSTEELRLLPHQERAGVGPHSSHMEIDPDWKDGQSEAPSLRTYRSRSKNSLTGIFHKNRMNSGMNHMGNSSYAKSDNVRHGSDNIRHTFDNTHHNNRHSDREGPMHQSSSLMHLNDNNISVIKSQSQYALEPDRSLSSTERNPQWQYPQRYKYKERSSFVTTHQRLALWSQFYEFQKAPITNFYRHTMAYLIFVMLLAYVILVPQDPDDFGFPEMYVVAYLATLGLEVCRNFLTIDALNWSQKLVEFKTQLWHIADFIGVMFFLGGVWLRFFYNFEYGMLIYRVSSIYWNLRLYKYMSVHRFLGPKIVMMSRMLKHMAYFAMIILVVIIAFGLARESIRFPDVYPTWRNVAEAFLEPYVMMFGEVDTDALAPQCGENDQPECPVGYWIIPLTWAVYMLVANILIVNVLIAVFNGIYSEIDEISLEVWMFQRFNFVMEFEEMPLLPPPAIILCHAYEIIRWLYLKTKLCICEQDIEVQMVEDDGPRIIMGNDHRLKTFLTSEEINMIFDFEEDNLALINPPKIYYNANTNEEILDTGNIEVYKDRQGLHQVKANYQDICAELELHRSKLDRLIAFWEVQQEKESDNSIDEPGPNEENQMSYAISSGSATEQPNVIVQQQSLGKANYNYDRDWNRDWDPPSSDDQQ